MNKIKLDDINKDTKLKFVVEFLDSIVDSGYPDKELSAYELGKGAGKVELLNMLKSRIRNKEE